MSADNPENKFISELRQQHENAGVNLKTELLQGRDTQPTRKKIAELADLIEREVEALKISVEKQTRARCDMQQLFIDQLCSAVRKQIDQRMAPLSLPEHSLGAIE